MSRRFFAVHGTPVRAAAAAGAQSSASSRVPARPCRVASAPMAPGAATACGPVSGTADRPRSRYPSAEAPSGPNPLPLTVQTRPSGSRTTAKKSPPIPHWPGSASQDIAVIASAASTAVPPSASTRAPAWLTAGELLLTMPPVASVEVRTGPQDAGHSPGAVTSTAACADADRPP
jgi:hypothetical protein